MKSSRRRDLGLALNKFAGYKVAPFIRYLVEERLQPVPFLSSWITTRWPKWRSALR